MCPAQRPAFALSHSRMVPSEEPAPPLHQRILRSPGGSSACQSMGPPFSRRQLCLPTNGSLVLQEADLQAVSHLTALPQPSSRPRRRFLLPEEFVYPPSRLRRRPSLRRKEGTMASK